MAHFQDLSICTYFPVDHEEKLVAVGWLDPDFEYARGDVDPDVMAKLCELLVSPWRPMALAGWHDCPYCKFSGGPRQFTFHDHTADIGCANLFLPGDGILFVAPSLLLHYIDSHDYAPPEAFCEAVEECPPMRSMAYLRRLLDCGPPAIVGKSPHR